MRAWSKEKISPLALVLLITGAIDSMRNLPGTALFGSRLIFFFIFAAVVFLIPVALIAAELTATFPEEEGGIYSWVRHAFGPNVAFVAIWLQWINTVVWYPTILSFIAGTTAYLINPELAQNKLYLIGIILTVFWLLTWLGLSGIKTSATFASLCTVLGMILPMILIIMLAAMWIIGGHPSAIDLHWGNFLPTMDNQQSWISLTAIMASFLGMELAAVHVRNVQHPQRNFPRSVLASAAIILITMIAGSLAIAIVLPVEQINLVDGVMQAFTNFFQVYHLTSFVPMITILILLGSLGGMVNWIISPAKGLLLAADHGFLPHWLYRLNHHGVPSRILIIQAILVTVLCGGFLLFPSINAIYWLFTDLSTELYLLMYVLMFLAAWKLKTKFSYRQRHFKIVGGYIGYYLVCILGLCGCITALIIGFIPPEHQHVTEHFRKIFALGIIFMLLPLPVFFLHRKRAILIDHQSL